MNKCSNCGSEIPEKRLNTFPNTNICSADCIEEIKFKEQVIKDKKIQNKIQEDINKINELSEKKYTCVVAFNKLKHALTSAPVLQPYDPELASTVVLTDVPTSALGAVLEHDIGDVRHPVAYYSRKLRVTRA